jgi:hypothetical protein
MKRFKKNRKSLFAGIFILVPYLFSAVTFGQTVRDSKTERTIARIEINGSVTSKDRTTRSGKANTKQRKAVAAFDDPVRIIVRFKSRWRPEGELGTSTERIRQRAQTSQDAARFVARISRLKPQEVRTYETIPLVAMVIERKDMQRLKRFSQVIALQEDIPQEIHLGSSMPVVGADTVQNSGYGGEGQTVVIIDTGVDINNNPNFRAGQIVAQGCFNPGTGGVITNLCPGGAVNLTGPAATNQNAGDDICGAVGAVGTCEHGTHVASIAAGVNGVAPEADIISLQVFHLRTNPNPIPIGFPPGQLCSNNAAPGAQCVNAMQADSLAALNEAALLADNFDIAAVNMSLGGGTNNAACDGDLRKVAIDNLRSRGIATVVSSGNAGLVNAMGAPACVSTAISVGSTVDTQLPAADNATGGAAYVQDLVSNFSNVAPFLDLHAPGTLIVGGAPVNSPCDNNFAPNADGQCRMNGTSMAAPHVTGAWAALKSLNPAARVEDVLSILQATGVAVADNRLNTLNGNAWTGNVGAGTQVPRVSIDVAMEQFDPHRGSVATGDFNCDGIRDIAMGSPNQTVNGAADAGEVSVLYGSSKGAFPWQNRHINQDSKDKNGKSAKGKAEAGDRFGHAVAAGDFNGDGCDDLAVGIPFEGLSNTVGQGPRAGMVQVFYGKPWGFDMGMDQLWNQDSQDIWGTAEDGDKFGWSLAVGDFNGDDLDDLAIGTPTESIGTTPASGAVTVMFGHGAGLDDIDSQMLHQNNLPPLVAEAGDLFGYAVTAGDFNNDGFSDLAVSAPRDTATADDSGADAGLVTIVNGWVFGVNNDQVKIFNQANLNANLESGDRFGFSLANGDFDNDGFDDLAIGVPSEDLEFTNGTIEDAGVIHVVPGSNSGLTNNGSKLFSQDTNGIAGSPESGDAFGYSLASGDFDNDGFADVVVGVPFEDIEANNAIDAGAVNIIRGSNSGLTAQGDQIVHQQNPGIMGMAENQDRFGEALASGNLNATDNGHPDLVVRVSGEDLGSSELGAVQLFYTKSGNGVSQWDSFIKLSTF